MSITSISSPKIKKVTILEFMSSKINDTEAAIEKLRKVLEKELGELNLK